MAASRRAVVCFAGLALAGCKRDAGDPAPVAPPPAMDAATVDAAPPVDAAPDASYDDLGQLDPRFLDGVVVQKDDVVDASELGAVLDVRLLERVTHPNPGLAVVEVLLVVSGTRTVAVDIGHTWEYEYDGDTPEGTLVVVGEEEAPRPWDAERDPSIEVRLPSRGPMLYHLSAESPHLVDTFVVVREKDRLVAFSYFVDDGDAADAWTRAATVKLPRGATLRFP